MSDRIPHTLAQFAVRVGLSKGRVRGLYYTVPSGLPKPDCMDAGGRPLWWVTTIDSWLLRRITREDRIMAEQSDHRITAESVAGAFKDAGLGEVGFPAPIARDGRGYLVSVELSADIPMGRFSARRRLILDMLGWAPDQVFVESAEPNRLTLWVLDAEGIS